MKKRQEEVNEKAKILGAIKEEREKPQKRKQKNKL